MRREPPESWPKRLADGHGEAGALLRKVDRQSRQAPSESAAWERTLRRLGRDSSRGRRRVALAAAAGAVAGAVALYAALARAPGGHAVPLAKAGAGVATPTSAGALAAAAAGPPSPPPRAAEWPVAGEPTAVEAMASAEAPRIQLGRAAVGLPAGRAELLGEAKVTLSRGGRASAFATSTAATVDLDAGEVELAVEKRPADAHHVFEVTAGAFRFTVLGTKFRVVRTNGDVTLSVTEGRVAVSRGALRLAVVTAGGFWAGTASAPAARADAGGDSRTDFRADVRTDLAMRAPAREPASPVGPTAPADHGPPTSRAAWTIDHLPADARMPLGAVTVRLAPPPFAAPAPAPSSTPGPRPVAGPATSQAPAPRPAARGAQGCGARTADPTSSASSSPPFSQSRLPCLLDEARGSDLGAEVALYEAARIYRDALGDTDHAIATLRELRRRFPASALSSEAALSLAELLPTVGRYREALVESAAVLGSRPTPERADEIHLMRGDLLRGGLGDCRSAVREYAQVAEVTRSSIADPAIFYGAVCLQTLGDGSGARRAFERYLARPAPRHAAEATRFLRELDRVPAP